MSRILSLCTGYAGLDLAVEAVTGARTVAVSDLDKGANKILAHRFPDIPNLGDLKAIDWSQWVGTEVMTAGYPCQPFSHAGKREGTDDPRHIFPFIADGIRVVGPRLVVLENVRGHLALGFDTVLGTLADIGYDARWVCVRASDVGAPHRRERMFIVATPHPSDVRHERVGVAWGRGVGPEDHGLAPADPEGFGHGDAGATSVGGVAPTAVAGSSSNAESYAGRVVDRDEVPPSHSDSGHCDRRTSSGQQGQARPSTRPVAGTDWGRFAPAINRWSAVLGRPAPAPTEPGSKGHPRLSPRFVEFMMGLPKGWVTDAPDLTRNEQLKALGNGVVPQQAAAALTFLLNAETRAA